MIMKRKTFETMGFWVLTLCLVLVSAFFITGTVMSGNNPDEQQLELYYREREQQLVRDTRDYLNQSGFRNSGVTLTRVVEEDGMREYTITVHHDKIHGMNETEREILKTELATLVFVEDSCSFSHEFLVTD